MSEVAEVLVGLTATILAVCVCLLGCVVLRREYLRRVNDIDLHRLAVEVGSHRTGGNHAVAPRQTVARSIELIEEDKKQVRGSPDARHLQYTRGRALMPPIGSSTTTMTIRTTTTSSRTASPAPPDVSDVSEVSGLAVFRHMNQIDAAGAGESHTSGSHLLSVGKPMTIGSHAHRSGSPVREELTRAHRDEIERRVGKQMAQGLYSRLTKDETVKLARLFGYTGKKHTDDEYKDEITSFLKGREEVSKQTAIEPTVSEQLNVWAAFQSSEADAKQNETDAMAEESTMIAEYFFDQNGEIIDEKHQLMVTFSGLFPGNLDKKHESMRISFRGIFIKYKIEQNKGTINLFKDFYRHFRSNIAKLSMKGPPQERDFSISSASNKVVEEQGFQIFKTLFE